MGKTYYQLHGERAVCIFNFGNRSILQCLAFSGGEAVMADSMEQAIKNARVSLELSGFKVEEYHTELVRKVLTGEMTNEEFLIEVKRLAQAKGGDPK
ncbi:hypothetical protein J7E38_16580 [Bacillus sp. ISL-35]|uniref:hypothetical protein n=1 Tax=Bacillus sp. ISL-35 TaxID=2819122 RepID=UPI001BE5659B|nr:hypothetical protein [Bacillus sp. ISL-35]MBT2680627.1 hypothetical protein [Bacillus sp. ISL-35]MBT2702742.1 hypothetical protein [Chryseobacterium sp. ISL-80]